jgi:outer membrane protein OmpA-like peptidoglycan-associated protein
MVMGGSLKRGGLGMVTFVFFASPCLSGGCASNQGKGAAIGGASGAGLGALIGAFTGGKKGALVGGAVGAAVGAGSGALIGHYMDKQEADLRKVKSADVQRQGDQLVVRFNSAILFDRGKYELKSQSRHDLADFASVLRSYADTDVVVEGHTDATGKRTVNQKLSEARATSVASFLETQGIAVARVTARGWADDHPVADNTTDQGRAQNRRVEINIAANQQLRAQEAQQQQQPATAP